MPSALSDRPCATRPARDSATEPRARAQPARQLGSDELLGRDREVLIRHGDQLYRLRPPRAGKLILTK